MENCTCLSLIYFDVVISTIKISELITDKIYKIHLPSIPNIVFLLKGTDFTLKRHPGCAFGSSSKVNPFFLKMKIMQMHVIDHTKPIEEKTRQKYTIMKLRN